MAKIYTKIAIVILTIVMLLGLCSCSIANAISHNIAMVNQTADADQNCFKYASSRAKAIVGAVKSKNINTLKRMFSKNSVSKITEIESKLDAFVNYCKGDFVSYKVTDQNETDNKAEAVSTNYIVITYKTNKNTYIIGCEDIILDTANRNNMGLFRINIYNESDSAKIKRKPSYYDTPNVTCGNG